MKVHVPWRNEEANAIASRLRKLQKMSERPYEYQLIDIGKVGGGFCFFGGWVAKVGSAPSCYGSSLGSNPDIYQKY
jgi:hypothetical protein